jgi:PKD repeat protein
VNRRDFMAGVVGMVFAQKGKPAPAPFAVTLAATPTTGVEPLTVTFTATATGGKRPYAYTWSFGDGGMAMGESVVHTYQWSGAWLAMVTATDKRGVSAMAYVDIIVEPYVEPPEPPPVPQPGEFILEVI